MKINLGLSLFILLLLPQGSYAQQKEEQPNVLWILTDDQRYDAIQAFNEILSGQEMSELGYVESPNVDRLVAEGTTFINTYCQAAACAPSRASMHFGRYPFKSGVYEFEYHNTMAAHVSPTLPEQMEAMGYQTLHIGKLGVRLKTLENQRMVNAAIYQTSIDSKLLAKEGLCEWGKDWIYEVDGQKFSPPLKSIEFFVSPSGQIEYCSNELEDRLPERAGTTAATVEKYDLLRHYNEKKGKSDESGMILAGVSPRPAGYTRDGYYVQALQQFLTHPNTDFEMGKLSFQGVDSSKPLFCHIGFDFPHTPVLPPEDYRKRFAQHQYQVPDFSEEEWEQLPAQLKKQVANGYSDHFTAEEKQKMIQDYYAFCAYGDALVGQAVEDFVDYSESNGQEWMIVYVCGDHGWKLNDHGSVSKFTPWEVDTHNPIVVVSSDQKAFPPGKVVYDFTEFVDIAPTIMAAGGADLSATAYGYLDGYDLSLIEKGQVSPRSYVLGENHAVTGPRAFIRTKDYVFSMQSRPDKVRGNQMDWAQNASYEELDPALYHTSADPKELHNLAFEAEYQQIAMELKEILLSEVLGEDRVEVNWGQDARGTEVYTLSQQK
ncbi:hypothetical protein GCM10007049_16600 [Echinicola pacifica]|uniref:Sulfatase N-terminal domain-containing protein n=1 Tax=Echinicola pacifica TaxID=346377 RepID=A0A918UNR4_9BACT|nr:sulfatase-like hydrolase/transferase [Echinicola pacifica]GGZ24860.1 hypothetical protein GCM10007049_16600 [Echinicola pacifica]